MEKIEVTKIPPLECPKCKSTRVYKNKAGSLICENCRIKITSSGKEEKLAEEHVTSKGYHPWKDTGDFFE